MKVGDAVLIILLLIVGVGLISMSFQPFENIKTRTSRPKYHSWSVSGWVEKGQVIAIDLKASSRWGTIRPGEEMEVFDARLNFTILCEGVGNVNVTCYYEVFLFPNEPTPVLSPKNVSIYSSSADFLDFRKSGPVDGFLAIGLVKVSGNFTLILDSETVWENFLSTDAPARLTLVVYDVITGYPYLLFLPVGLSLLGIGAYMLILKSRLNRRRTSILKKKDAPPFPVF